MSRPDPARVHIIVGSLLLAAVIGCGGSERPGSAATPPCEIPPETPTARIVPKDLGLADHGTITEAARAGRRLTATLVTETEINLLYPPLARKLLDSGYFMISSENEGTDAEIFFARGRISGVYLMKHGRPCGDLVTLTLDYVREPR
ncbi:MAG: hypothetical protein ACRDKT_08480 [Actinomycetota bacterium]